MTASIPPCMAHLPLDEPGYPIPWSVFTDQSGRPHFTINDDRKRFECFVRDVCPICARKLNRGRWFIAGPMSAFHPNGAFADPPMHFECMRYAATGCPYLAAPRYAKRIDDRTLSADDRPPLLLDHTVISRRPDVFIAVLARGQRLTGPEYSPNVIPSRPYIRVEYWRHGTQLHPAVGKALIDAERPSWPQLIEERKREPAIIAKSGRS